MNRKREEIQEGSVCGEERRVGGRKEGGKWEGEVSLIPLVGLLS